MSLIPYASPDSREIVLRHNDAVVLRDTQTQQLFLHGAQSSSHCPTCHQIIRSSSPEHHEPSIRPTAYISSNYFRLLRDRTTVDDTLPVNPVRRLVEPASEQSAQSTGSSFSTFSADDDQSQDQNISYSIKKEAFSQGYFQKFFIVEKELGRGGKGVVLLVRHELDGVSLGQFACKRVPVGDDHAWLEKVLVEVQLLQELSHVNLVSYRHVWLENVILNRFSPSVPCAFILQQYCNAGDLLQFVIGVRPILNSSTEQMKERIRRNTRGQAQFEKSESSKRKLNFDDIYSIFKDIVSGIAHLHASNYIHRDLKPSNCLLHQEGKEIRCLISDFGEVQVENMVRKSSGTTGTISYCAPEVLKQDSSGRYGNFTTKSDMFSLGMILYFMCFGGLPYESADSVDEDNEDITLLRAEITSWPGFHGKTRQRTDLPNQLYDLLKRLLAVDPDQRPSTIDILTAIRTEKGFGSPAQPRQSGNPNLGGRLLHSLRSTVPIVEPINGSTDQVESAAYIEDDIISDSELPELDRTSNLLIKSSITGSQPNSPSYQSPPLSPHFKLATPLLMPPPLTPLTKFQTSIAIYKLFSYEWLRRTTLVPGISVSLLLYMVKLWSLTTPCKPNLVRAWVWWPLAILAAFELAAGNKSSWRLVAWTTTIHFSTLVVLTWWYDGINPGLCGRINDFWA